MARCAAQRDVELPARGQTPHHRRYYRLSTAVRKKSMDVFMYTQCHLMRLVLLFSMFLRVVLPEMMNDKER